MSRNHLLNLLKCLPRPWRAQYNRFHVETIRSEFNCWSWSMHFLAAWIYLTFSLVDNIFVIKNSSYLHFVQAQNSINCKAQVTDCVFFVRTLNANFVEQTWKWNVNHVLFLSDVVAENSFWKIIILSRK